MSSVSLNKKSEIVKTGRVFLSRLMQIADKIPDLLIHAGIAYAGYRAVDHWTGALSGMIFYRLARGQNLAGGIAGVAGLAAIGVTNLVKPWWIVASQQQSQPSTTTTTISTTVGGPIITNPLILP